MMLRYPSLLVMVLILWVFGQGLSWGETPEGAGPQASDVSEAMPGDDLSETEQIPDPFEPLNRVFFVVNDKLYFWVLKPTANLYSFFVPEWGRMRVRNVVRNLATPVRFVNSLLQLQLNDAAKELSRCILNSTVGLGGMFDVANRHPELARSDRDLGQTLGVYGIGTGFYLVLPVLGPTSLRDGIGMAGDHFLIPESYITPFADSLEVSVFERVNEVSLRIGDYEDFKEASLEPYVAMRDAYQEYRKSKVRGRTYEGPLYIEKERR